jgi:hypothetical protein
MMRFGAAVILALLSMALTLSAGPCVPGDTLAQYIALGAGGCTVGPLVVENFSFSVLSSGGGDTPIDATDIIVTPDFGAASFGLSLSSTGFSVSGSQFVNYQIGYTWDPTGDLRGLGDVLDPGTADVVTDGCVGIAFSGSSCSGTPVSVSVSTTDPTAFVPFAQTNILGILETISLNANGGSASFNGIENDAYVPEPSTVLTALFGLTLLAALLRIPRQPGFHCASKIGRFGQQQ